MSATTAAAVRDKTGEAGSFYDRIARLYGLTFKFNRYGRSMERYLRENPLPLRSQARVLDAGCGTGLLTLALMKSQRRPARITAIDLSGSSIVSARNNVSEVKFEHRHEVEFAQANVLSLPFADETFDLIVTSGALEYVSLEEGMSELARVLTSGGYLIHLPVKPSLIGRLLEIMFHFKTHPPQEVARNTQTYFRVVAHYEFPPLDPIGWSKTAVLAQKD